MNQITLPIIFKKETNKLYYKFTNANGPYIDVSITDHEGKNFIINSYFSYNLNNKFMLSNEIYVINKKYKPLKTYNSYRLIR